MSPGRETGVIPCSSFRILHRQCMRAVIPTGEAEGSIKVMGKHITVYALSLEMM